MLKGASLGSAYVHDDDGSGKGGTDLVKRTGRTSTRKQLLCYAGAPLVWRRDFAHERRLAAQVTADLLQHSGVPAVHHRAQPSTGYSIPTDAGALEVLSAAARLTDARSSCRFRSGRSIARSARPTLFP